MKEYIANHYAAMCFLLVFAIGIYLFVQDMYIDEDNQD